MSCVNGKFMNAKTFDLNALKDDGYRLQISVDPY